MSNRSRLSTIARVDAERPETWAGLTFLCFDIDWAVDDVLADTIHLVEEARVPATWFVTHDTPLLARLRANPSFELAIHPNFNRLLFEGDHSNGSTAAEILDRLLAIVPEARSVRSHSVTQSSRLIEEFGKRGLTHQSNSFIPASAGLPVRPWRLWNGMTDVPYDWADDAHMVYGWQKCPAPGASPDAAQVVTFHPVHVFINSSSLGHYEASRHLLGSPEQLRTRRRSGEGTRSWLESFLAP